MDVADRKQLLEDLLQSMDTMRKRVFITDSVVKMHVSPAQWLAMRVILHHPDCTLKAVAQKLHVSSSAATQLIDKLVESGYVIRKESRDDRRSVTLSLATKAEKEIKLLKAQMQARLSDAFKALDDHELKEFVRLLNKIADRKSYGTNQ